MQGKRYVFRLTGTSLRKTYADVFRSESIVYALRVTDFIGLYALFVDIRGILWEVFACIIVCR